MSSGQEEEEQTGCGGESSASAAAAKHAADSTTGAFIGNQYQAKYDAGRTANVGGGPAFIQSRKPVAPQANHSISNSSVNISVSTSNNNIKSVSENCSPRNANNKNCILVGSVAATASTTVSTTATAATTNVSTTISTATATATATASANKAKISEKLQNNQFIRNQNQQKHQKQQQQQEQISSMTANKVGNNNCKMVAMQDVKKGTIVTAVGGGLSTGESQQHNGGGGRVRNADFVSNNYNSGDKPQQDLIDNEEELHYGPGIVSKLRCRYLSLALRESMEQQRTQVLRRSTSLSTLLDRDDDEHDEIGPASQRQRQYKPNVNNNGNFSNSNSNRSMAMLSPMSAAAVDSAITPPLTVASVSLYTKKSPVISGSGYQRYAYGNGTSPATTPRTVTQHNSVESEADLTASTIRGMNHSYSGDSGSGSVNENSGNVSAQSMRSRHLKRGNEIMKRARSVEALLCEKTHWQYAQQLSSSSGGQQRCTGGGGDNVVTIEDKIHNARERLHTGADIMPPKRLTSIIDDTERPPPDLVKQTLMKFEASANLRTRMTHRNSGNGDVATKVANYKSIIKEQKPAVVLPKPTTTAGSPSKKLLSSSAKTKPGPGFGYEDNIGSSSTPPDIIPRQHVPPPLLSNEQQDRLPFYSPVSSITKLLGQLKLTEDAAAKAVPLPPKAQPRKLFDSGNSGRQESRAPLGSAWTAKSAAERERLLGDQQKTERTDDTNECRSAVEMEREERATDTNSDTDNDLLVGCRNGKSSAYLNDAAALEVDVVDEIQRSHIISEGLTKNVVAVDSGGGGDGAGDKKTPKGEDNLCEDKSSSLISSPTPSPSPSQSSSLPPSPSSSPLRNESIETTIGNYDDNDDDSRELVTDNKQRFITQGGSQVERNVENLNQRFAAAGNQMMSSNVETHEAVQTKQIGIIRPIVAASTTIEEKKQQPSLTSREIEKNRINEMKKTAATYEAVRAALKSSSTVAAGGGGANSSLDQMPTAHVVSADGRSERDVSGPATTAGMDAPIWALRKRRQNLGGVSATGSGNGEHFANTVSGNSISGSIVCAENTSMVFDFSKSNKEVPDYIESDIVIYRRKRELPKPNESGFVLLGDPPVDASTDSDNDDFSMCPPSPCDVEFENANIVIDGKSSLRQKSKESSFHVQFNDTLTSTFEYPSEASLSADYTQSEELVTVSGMEETDGPPPLVGQSQHHHVAVDEIIELPMSASAPAPELVSSSPLATKPPPGDAGINQQLTTTATNILGNIPLDGPNLAKVLKFQNQQEAENPCKRRRECLAWQAIGQNNRDNYEVTAIEAMAEDYSYQVGEYKKSSVNVRAADPLTRSTAGHKPQLFKRQTLGGEHSLFKTGIGRLLALDERAKLTRRLPTVLNKPEYAHLLQQIEPSLAPHLSSLQHQQKEQRRSSFCQSHNSQCTTPSLFTYLKSSSATTTKLTRSHTNVGISIERSQNLPPRIQTAALELPNATVLLLQTRIPGNTLYYV